MSGKAPKADPSLLEDMRFFEQVEKLTRTARNAIEEADVYVRSIKSPRIRKLAKKLLEEG